MMNKSCPLCGIIFPTDGEMCETCQAMMSGVAQPPPVSATNAPLETVSDQFSRQNSVHSEESFQAPPFFQPNDGFSSNQAAFNDPQPNYQSNYQPNYQPGPSFAPPGNSYQAFPPPPRRDIAPPVESEYKPSVWNWITELPTFVKIGAVVLIFSVCFAMALKSFMLMDVSVTSNPNLEPQKPWFSSWFRAQPTAEEIFDKFETVTYAKGKKLVTQNCLISGKAQIVRGAQGAMDFTALKKDPEAPFKPSATPPPGAPTVPPIGMQQPNQLPFPKPPDFNITFEISLKSPNKMLTKMMMKPKEGFSQAFVAYKNFGFDGRNGWSFTKTFMMGNVRINDEPYQNNDLFFSRSEDGISMTMQRAMYSKLEVLGEEVIYNRRNYNVQVTNAAGETANIFFDVETGLAAKVKQKASEFYILRYDNFDGVLHPSDMVYELNGEWMLLRIEKFDSNAALDDLIFERSAYQ
jgi:hypothetical protein